MCTAKTVNAYWGAGGGTANIGYSDNHNGTYTYYGFNDNHWFQWWDRFVWYNSNDVIDFHINNNTAVDILNNNRFGASTISLYDFGTLAVSTKNLTESFHTCFNLSKLDICHWNLSACTSTYAMIAQAIDVNQYTPNQISALREVNMPETMSMPNCTRMHKMFAWNRGLKKITGMKNVDFSAVTNFSEMFCENFQLNDVEFKIDNWVTSAATDIHSMFLQCFKLDLSSLGDFKTWDVSNVTDFSGCFGRTSTSNIDLSGWNMTSATNIDDMFSNTSILDNNYQTMPDAGFRTINLSNVQMNPDNIAKHNKVFDNCNHLTNIILSGCSDNVIDFIKVQLIADVPNRIKSDEFKMTLDDGDYRYNGTDWSTVA